MRRWARVWVAALVALPILLGAHAASAATTSDAARTAAAALARKAADLVALNAWASGQQTDALDQALAGLPLAVPTGRTALLSRLTTDDRAGAAALAQLSSGNAQLSRETRTALGSLTSSQLAALRHGSTLTDLVPGVVLEALDDLVERNGAPPTTLGVPPDPQRVNTALAQDLAGAATAAHHGASYTWLWVALVAIGALVVAAVATGGRRRPARATATRSAAPGLPQRAVVPGAFPVASTMPAPAAVHTVLDASRRLTMLPVGEDMPRAIVREALTLVPGRAAALVERRGDALTVAYESQPGLLVPDGFGAGVIDQAANTARLVAQPITSDPSFARQPAQVLLLPLVSAGRVDAVVVIVRDPGEPFLPAERELLATLAPVAAAARESASRTQAAVDASLVDPLTGVGNRRQLDAHLATVLREPPGGQTALCMVDLDHFKTVNDTHGHPAGDALLRQVCARIRETVRPTDGVYRYGGEEFCLLLPATSLAEAQETAERVRAAIAAQSYDVGGGQLLTATASLGVAVTTDADVAALLHAADAALYEAKRSGRNRVCVG